MARVDFLMPFYNSRDFLRDGLQSLLDQTFQDWRLVAVNDGSSDASDELLKMIQPNRLKVVSLPSNMGIVSALNAGLGVCDAEYIARFDADDICDPHRLELQIEFMDHHRSIDVLGTAINRFGAKKGEVRFPESDSSIRCRMPFFCTIAHPTVMLRHATLRKLNLKYSPDFQWAEDWGLWLTGLKELRFSNLNQVLVNYRVHSSSVTASKVEGQRHARFLVLQSFFETADLKVPDQVLKVAAGLHERTSPAEFEELEKYADFLISKSRIIGESYGLDLDEFMLAAREAWFGLCLSSTSFGPRVVREFFRMNRQMGTPHYGLKHFALILFSFFRLSNPWKAGWLEPFV